jgi:hypothetical protein
MDNFINNILQGKEKIKNIHDWVDKWHENDDQVELHEYLGMRLDEYSLWIQGKLLIEDIIKKRKGAE